MQAQVTGRWRAWRGEPSVDGGTPPSAGTVSALSTAAPASTAPAGNTVPTVSVVVCAFSEERWDDLCQAIAGLRSQTQPPYEVILVVDHCSRLLLRASRELSGVTVVANRFEQGLSGGRNTGVGLAGADVVAFLDDDAAPDTDWVARLAAPYSDSQVIGVGGLVRPAWDTERPTWFPPELDWVVGCSYQGMPVARGQVRNFIGANMSFRRGVLRKSGGFSTRLGRVGTVPLGCEETELCLRASSHHPGAVLLYEPAAAVSHRVRAQRATWAYLRSRCYAEGVSKARVARLAGARRALSAERSFLGPALRGVVARTPGALRRHGLAGLAPVLALAVALAWAGAGYVLGRTGVAWLLGALGRTRAARGLRWAAGLAVAPWAGLAASLALWGFSLTATHAGLVPASALGLAGVLPTTFWAALAVLVASFGVSVTRRGSRWLLPGGHLLALVAMLHATPAAVYGTLRYSWAWKHVGVTDYIAHHGVNAHLGGILGAYQGWPGFFALNAFLAKGSGLGSALAWANWTLVVNDLLWLGPILLIARVFSDDWRFAWTAAWLFELGNWVGQDYFSPQAFAFFLYLVVLAVCLRWLADPRSAAGGQPPTSRGRRYLMLAAMAPLMAAIASSHQLTPFMLIAALTVLAVFRQLRPKVAPVALAVAIAAGWLAYGALPWLSANSYQIFEGLGVPWANTSAHLVGGGPVPSGQLMVDWGARLLSAGCGGLAVVGFWRYRRHHDATARRSWWRVALLAVAAMPAAAANSYGGEIIFRVFLFALPFFAVAGAAAFFPRRAARGGLALVVASIVLVGGFVLGNYGKDAMNYFTPAEVAASQWLYRTAPPGAQVVAANSNFPWAFTHYNSYTYTFLDTPPSLGAQVSQSPVSEMAAILGPGRSPASYLILTTSQEAEDGLQGPWSAQEFTRVAHTLETSAEFRVVYRNAEATVLQLATAPATPSLPGAAQRGGAR